VTESVKPNVVCWYPQLLRIGFSTYLTELSLLSGVKRLCAFTVREQ
jgi:hypothetical protein